MTPADAPAGNVTDQPTGIDRAVARDQIVEILHAYAHMAIEQADFGGMSVLFHPDGQFVLPDQKVVPCTEIHRVVNGTEPTFIRHHISTIQIDFTSATTASTDSYFVAATDLAWPDHWGRWRDSFRRGADGRWLMTSKAPIIEGFSPTGWAATVLMPTLTSRDES